MKPASKQNILLSLIWFLVQCKEKTAFHRKKKKKKKENMPWNSFLIKYANSYGLPVLKEKFWCLSTHKKKYQDMLYFFRSHNFHFSQESAVQINSCSEVWLQLYISCNHTMWILQICYIHYSKKDELSPTSKHVIILFQKYNNTIPHIEMKLYLKKG